MLGEQKFEKACQFIHDHDIKKMGLEWINVNLSPIQFLRPDLNHRFSQILEKYGVDAELIHLEITEESMVDYTLLQKQISIVCFLNSIFGCFSSHNQVPRPIET